MSAKVLPLFLVHVVKISEVGKKGKGKNQEVVTVFRGLLFLSFYILLDKKNDRSTLWRHDIL
jgi:hypothetical protein